jgi:small subunit ribosomal protein S4
MRHGRDRRIRDLTLRCPILNLSIFQYVALQIPEGLVNIDKEDSRKGSKSLMNTRGAKIRLSRQLGIAITPKVGKALERRPNPPGQHGGTKDRLKGSDYKRHLREKQRLRAQYNIDEKQMRNYVRMAMQRPGNPVDSLVQLLETRLDAIVYRAGLARTIYAAQPFISHGHILVNPKNARSLSHKN